ncbi:hypothetical protein BH23GEM6_BH23GEM6_26880 [soil metagenome]
MLITRYLLPVVVSVAFAITVPDLRHVVLASAGVAPNPAALAHAGEVAEPHPASDPAAVAAPLDDAVMRRVETSLAQLDAQVHTRSHPDALRHAFRAYFNYADAHPERVKKPYLYFVDFGLDSGTARGYVFDMRTLTVVEGPFMVAHGRGSVQGSAIPTRFSNQNGSNATSLGLYLAQETYAFRGRSAGRSYASVGLRLQGVSGRFNNAARTRGIVVHGAPYVSHSNAGRSEGCPAMTEALAEALLPRLANGGMVFHFSPLDPSWLREDPWINGLLDGRLAAK